MKQEIASSVIEKLSGLITEEPNAAAQLFQPKVQHRYSACSNEGIAAATLNPLHLPQGLLQHMVVERARMSLPEYDGHLNDNVQAQQKRYKCDLHENHTHYSFMPQCFVPSQTHAKLDRTVPKKVGYVNHLYQPSLQKEPLTLPPVPFQAQVKAPTSLQWLAFPPNSIQSPPMAKLLASVQQIVPAQLPSQLFQHQRPLVQLVAKRIQATQQQARTNHPKSLHIKESNSNFLLRPSVMQDSKYEGDIKSAAEKVLKEFHPFIKVKIIILHIMYLVQI